MRYSAGKSPWGMETVKDIEFIISSEKLQRRKIPMGDGNFKQSSKYGSFFFVTAQENPHGGWKL